MAVFNFTVDGSTFDVIVDGDNRGTWDKVDEVDSEHSLVINDNVFIFSLRNPFLSESIRATDTIQVDGTPLSGTLRAKVAELKDDVFFSAAAGGGSVTIGATSYDDNATALAALGAGVLYKSTTLINGSPIILITV